MAHKNERGHENEDIKGKTQVLVARNQGEKKIRRRMGDDSSRGNNHEWVTNQTKNENEKHQGQIDMILDIRARAMGTQSKTDTYATSIMRKWSHNINSCPYSPSG